MMQRLHKSERRVVNGIQEDGGVFPLPDQSSSSVLEAGSVTHDCNDELVWHYIAFEKIIYLDFPSEVG